MLTCWGRLSVALEQINFETKCMKSSSFSKTSFRTVPEVISTARISDQFGVVICFSLGNPCYCMLLYPYFVNAMQCKRSADKKAAEVLAGKVVIMMTSTSTDSIYLTFSRENKISKSKKILLSSGMACLALRTNQAKIGGPFALPAVTR